MKGREKNEQELRMTHTRYSYDNRYYADSSRCSARRDVEQKPKDVWCSNSSYKPNQFCK